jgi:hypothetical protein
MPLEGVLEARQGRLRGQIGTGFRIPPQEKLEQRIAPEPGGVVTILVAGRQAVDPLLEESQRVVPHPRGVATVRQVGQDPLGETETPVSGLEEQQASVRGRRRLVELGQNGATEKAWENETLCRRIQSQEEASFVPKLLLDKLFLAHGGFFVFNFVNDPG